METTAMANHARKVEREKRIFVEQYVLAVFDVGPTGALPDIEEAWLGYQKWKRQGGHAAIDTITTKVEQGAKL